MPSPPPRRISTEPTSSTASTTSASGAPTTLISAPARPGPATSAPEVAKAFTELGFEPHVKSPAELARAVKEENANWGPIVKRVGFTPEA